MPDRSLPEVRKGQGDVALPRGVRPPPGRALLRSLDAVRGEIDRIIEVAWKNYDKPTRVLASESGARLADPEFELPIEWLEAWPS